MTDSARLAALDCVMAVTVDDAYANLVLPSIVKRRGLSGRDAGFATELAYGSLRMQGFYDAVISAASRRDPESLDPVVRAVLWLGAHQALSMNTPAHAAVSETVDLVVASGARKARGFVNAVMRRITERSVEAWQARVSPGNSRDAIAVRTSHPRWIVNQLERSLAARGRGSDIEALLNAHNTPARVTLVARPGLIARDALVEQSGGSPTRLSPFGVSAAGGDVADIPAIAAGTAGVQDEGSQVAALTLASAAARPVSDKERWLDMCAGPGGKTALLGAIAADRDATVDAIELHKHRAELVRNSVRAVPHAVVSVHHADALEWDAGTYDRILLDAPCTGLGALRRRPESRWRRTEGDLADLTHLQRRLLEKAQALLAPGGVIAYVTCSPVLAETREIVERSGLASIDARPVLADVTQTAVEEWGDGPDLQLWTHEHGTDSMYIALLTHMSGTRFES